MYTSGGDLYNLPTAGSGGAPQRFASGGPFQRGFQSQQEAQRGLLESYLEGKAVAAASKYGVRPASSPGQRDSLGNALRGAVGDAAGAVASGLFGSSGSTGFSAFSPAGTALAFSRSTPSLAPGALDIAKSLPNYSSIFR